MVDGITRLKEVSTTALLNGVVGLTLSHAGVVRVLWVEAEGVGFSFSIKTVSSVVVSRGRLPLYLRGKRRLCTSTCSV